LADIKKVGNNKCWGGCGEKGPLQTVGGNYKLAELFGKTVWRLPNKLKIELPYDSVIPLLYASY
jgi:hypothetical protein